MVRVISKVALAATCMLVLAVFAQQAKANGTDFTCGGVTCTGSVVALGSNQFSGSGIDLTSGIWALPVGDGDEGGETFVLAFNTTTPTGGITLTDTDGDALLTGNITNVLAIGSSLQLTVIWTTPAGFTSNPGFVIVNALNISKCTGNGCAVVSADVFVQPVPEPASLLLLGTGLLGLGGAVRRRWLN